MTPGHSGPDAIPDDGVMRFLLDSVQSGDAGTLHERLAVTLRAGLAQGVLRPGAPIPAERDLAGALGLSRVTVRRAIKSLVDERLLVQRPGARTSVAQRVEKPVSLFAGFSQDMQARGMKPGTIWLGRGLGVASPAEALALSLSPGATVVRLHRLRTADDTPIALERSVVSTRFLPDPDLVGESLYTTLGMRGTVLVRGLQRMRATVACAEDAALLGIQPGAPLFDMERRCFNEAGQSVEFCRSLYRGDLYDLLVELAR